MEQRKLPFLVWLLLSIPFFKPALFGVMEELSLLETFFDLWRLLAAGVICLLFLYVWWKKKRGPSPVLLAFGTYLLIVLVSTVYNAENYWETGNYVVTIFAFCVLVEMALREDVESALDMLYYPLTVLIGTNFILECLYPAGVTTGGTYYYAYNFMGIDNFLAPVMIPYMVLAAIRAVRKTGELDLSAYAAIAVCSVNLLLDQSATGLMGLAVALLFLLFLYKRKLECLFNSLTALAVSIGMFVGIVLLRLQDLFAWLIEGILGKGLSFTGRTDIWDIGMKMIAQKPLLGWGYAKQGKIYRVVKGKYYHGHNVYLELLMEGGVCALAAFLTALGFSACQLMKYRKEPCARLIAAGLMSWAVMTSMEPFLDTNGLMIYALFIMGYHVKYLITKPTKEQAESVLPETV